MKLFRRFATSVVLLTVTFGLVPPSWSTSVADVSIAPAFDTNQTPEPAGTYSLISTDTGAYFQAETLAEGSGIWYWEPGMSEPEFQSDFPHSFDDGYSISNAVKIGDLYYFHLTTGQNEMAQFYSFDLAGEVGSRIVKLTDFALTEWNQSRTLTVFDGKIIHLHFEDATGYEYYSFDPVTNQRELFLDRIEGTSYPASGYGPVVQGGKLYAAWGTNYKLNELYQVNTSGVATQITTGSETQVSWIKGFPTRNLLMFSAVTAAEGEELWTFDTNSNTLSGPYDLYLGSESSSPYLLGEFNNRFYFSAQRDANENENLYAFDPVSGEFVGDYMFRVTSFTDSNIFAGFGLGANFYFAESPPSFAPDVLWQLATDGTLTKVGEMAGSYFSKMGTSLMLEQKEISGRYNPYYLEPSDLSFTQIADFSTRTASISAPFALLSDVFVTDDHLVIGGSYEPDNGNDALYYYDLAAQGTSSEATVIFDSSSANLFSLSGVHQLSGKLVVEYGGFFGSLWVFDPANPQSPAVSLETRENYSSFSLHGIQQVGDVIYISADINGVDGIYSWADPAQSPVLLATGNFSAPFYVVGTKAFFFKYSADTGVEPWRYDFLTDTEEIFLDANAGPADSGFYSSQLIDGRLFTNFAGENGREPHVLDFNLEPGDPNALYEIVDTNPSGDGYGVDFLKIGNKVAFRSSEQIYAFDPETKDLGIVDGTGTSAAIYPDKLAAAGGMLVALANEPGTSSDVIMYVDISGSAPAEGFTPQIAVPAEKLFIIPMIYQGDNQVYFIGDDYYPWGTELLSLTITPTQSEEATPSQPASYQGPVVHGIPATISAGERITLLGSQLDRVSGIAFGSSWHPLAELDAEQGPSQLTLVVPEDLAPGTIQLSLRGDFGTLRIQQNIEVLVLAASQSPRVELKEIPGSNKVKVYIFDLPSSGKTSLYSLGKQIAWFDPVRTPNRLRTLSGQSGPANYFVRTITKEAAEGLRVVVDGTQLSAADFRSRS